MESKTKYPKLGSARVLKPFGTKSIDQFPATSKIILDKAGTCDKKLHQVIYQQGSHYGSVGDMCDYISHSDLFKLAEDGFIRLMSPKGTAIFL